MAEVFASLPDMDAELPRTTQTLGEDIGRVTPMMEQFIEIKAANPDCLLFYRMGDFYELFFEDAEIASRALGIVLTKRGKHLGNDIPMCGVPVERSDEYLHRLIALGHRVAVCEQLEDPAEAKKRGG
jgi:DNA mismatch repair protein MutS